jgi:cytochrome b involved in lipid metabolism
MVKDIKGVEIKPKMKVVCIKSSVLLAKVCTHYFNKPTKNKNWKNHLDTILNLKDAEVNGNKKFARVLTVKDMSNGYLSFYNDKDVPEEENLQHYHPANKFMVINNK